MVNMTAGSREAGSLGSNYFNYISRMSMASMFSKLSKPTPNRAEINYVRNNQGHTKDKKVTSSKAKQRSRPEDDKHYCETLKYCSYIGLLAN